MRLRRIVALVASISLVMTAAAITPGRVAAYTYLAVTDFECGYDSDTNLMLPLARLTRSFTEDGDLRAAVGMLLYDSDDPTTLVAQLGTGRTSDGVLANGAYDVAIDGFETFTPEAAAFGDDNFGGPPLIPGHDYLITLRLQDFGADLSPEFDGPRTCTATEFVDTDEDGLSDSDEETLYLTDSNNPDTDGDALGDGHEVLGYDADGDGSIDLPLPSYGVNPLRKDILVEIDHMGSDGTHSHAPTPSGISAVVAAFDNAPIANPDGSFGVNLHVDYGAGAPLVGGGTWGSASGASVLAHTTALGSMSGGDYSWTDFNNLKAANFNALRRPFFHYSVFAHLLDATLAPNESPSGISYGIGASDFIVSMGGWSGSTGTAVEQGGTFMHELGHNLNLRHGGADDVNWKPNYISVMNYWFQSGINVGGGLGFDYSRQALAALDEGRLDEAGGIGTGSFGTKWFCPDGIQTQTDDASTADWDCDGTQLEADVAANVNLGISPHSDASLGLLSGHDDWAAVVFNGGGVGDFGTPPTPPATTPVGDELTFEVYEQIIQVVDDPPIASDSSIEVREGQATLLDLSFLATDPESQPLTFAIVDSVDHGTLGDCSSGFCTYTPSAGYTGPDAFTWTASDGTSTSSVATMSINVAANNPPVATNQSIHAFTDTPRTLNLAASDEDFDFLTFTVLDLPDHGSLDDCSSGTCTYTPSGGFIGTDTFTWKANDGTDDSNVAAVTITVGPAKGKVLILATTVSGSPSLEEQRAFDLGFTADVVSESTWSTMTAAEFAAYRALIIGDTGSNPQSAYDTLEATKATWGSQVDGNVIVIGTDPTDHSFSGGQAVVDNGIAFAVDEADRTGLYLTFSDTFSGAVQGDPVPGTSTLSSSGAFTFGDVGGCLENAHIVAAHPALSGMTDASLSNWGCSVHNTFGTWPSDFLVLVIATDGSGYTANDGTTGTPYILARGEDLVVISDIDLTPLSATNPVGTSHELTAVVSDTSGPIVGTTVTFTVTEGPHTGTSGTDTTDSTGTASFTYSGTSVGTDTIKATFVDGDGQTQTSNLVTKTWEDAANTPPTVDAGGPYTGDEGSAVSLDGTVTDPDAGDTLTTTWTYAPGSGVDAGATCSFGSASAVDTTVTCTDDGAYTLTLTANDGVNSDVVDTASLTLANVDPTVDITAPADAAIFGVGRTVSLSAEIDDAGANDTHTCSINWGDGTTEAGTVASGTCTGDHAYSAVGVYTITVTVTDDDAGDGTDEIMVVVSDRTTKVTGGGFIVDGGRASFGFVAKENAAGLHGQIQIRAPGGNRFHGDTVTSLAGDGMTATWTGTGRWNGEDGYTFEVSVVDNRSGGKKKTTPADHVVIVIRDGTGAVVFEASGYLKGGNVTVH